MDIARAGLETDEAVEAVEQYIDLSGMIDYLLINFYAGNVDWDQNNWFGGRRRTRSVTRSHRRSAARCQSSIRRVGRKRGSCRRGSRQP